MSIVSIQRKNINESNISILLVESILTKDDCLFDEILENDFFSEEKLKASAEQFTKNVGLEKELGRVTQAKEQISREPYDLPKITITERNWYQHQLVKERLGPKKFEDIILSYRPDCFELTDYKSHTKLRAPLSN
jgi:hypothetical protein